MTEATPQMVVDGAVPLHPVISPDGRWVAYAVAPIGMREKHPVSALWVAAADGSSPPRKLTAGTANDSVPRWAPDSASLFFASDRRERGVPQLHRISLDGGEAEALTAWKGGISDHLPLGDAHLVAVIAADEPTEEDERRESERDDAKVWGERVPYDRLRLLDLGTGELRVVDGLGDRHVVEVVQRPDGGPLAVLSWAAPDGDPVSFASELHVVDPETGKVQDLGRTELQAFSPAWWNTDGAWHLIYLAVTPPSPVGGLAVFDVTVPETGAAGEHRNLTIGMTVCPSGLAQVTGSPPLALFADGLDTAIYRLDPEARRFQPVFSMDGFADSLTVSRSGEVVAVVASTSYEPKNVHAGPPAGPLIRLSDTRPELRQVRWGTQERLSYKASDGLVLDGLLILPVGRSRDDGPFPLITLVHGGPYHRHPDQFMLSANPSGQWLATAGYAVFLPNPRGGEGHGHDFAATVAGAVGMEEWTDILGGIDLLIAEGVADPDRLGIGGGSHGGFMAAWAIGQTNRFKAALVGAGISDWGMLVATGEGGILEAGLGGSVGWEGPGPHPHDRLSPISFASKIRTPVLILHGENDTNVPLAQATFFHRALRHFDVEHEFVVYPREGHSFRERNHQLDVLRRTRAWFGRWLGDPAPDR
ncbi:Dipeptidyl aminopeptidase/acylaminoacyl peptidase [Streptosporangium subroseum]|uniref:Dipeptidyl aminopeptidase/acylaminoacyl peptidase n=1 Tax=Streptosporangium subroseum TaxID=106412 RepID=A0A239HN44_9ACTN|nr:S9 family peptidase [Streptosporangium subroseum]SNS82760.1 Dipeptidyl aminopeptidase/acylaminoacyl peptidase [Streptosporangium subroseum]